MTEVANQNVAIISIITVAMISCMANVFCLEKLLGQAKNSSHLITFSCFLLLSIEGFIFTSRFGTAKRHIPLSYYAQLVAIFFVSNVINNLVFRFHIPMTLHMIFKSGSLLTNLIMGVILLNKRYSSSKYISVILITAGIVLCTYASSTTKVSDEAVGVPLYEYIVGLTLLASTLISSSYMGILQERMTTAFGRFPRESLFYNHALPLPFFMFLASDISGQVTIFNQSEPVIVPWMNIGIPVMWVWLIANTLTQFCCINSVFQLTSHCSSLTVTLVITIRKFLSLLISIFYFGNTFTSTHWVGTALVFGGSALFADLHLLLGPTSKQLDKKMD